jgi:Flp pilus assembly pilin Flp
VTAKRVTAGAPDPNVMVTQYQIFRTTNVMFKQFLKDETGLELSEYAVAAALIAVAVAGVFTALGDAISLKITDLAGHISTGK